MCEVPVEVVNDNGERGFVVDIVVKFTDGIQSIPVDNFNDKYEEYLDPKDIEIARLKRELEKYKAQVPKKKRRIITEGERNEIKALILKGEGNRPLATEYQVSETVISKIRVQMRKEGMAV